MIQLARALGMTGQELRRELSQVDFGVKATDREIPDILAQGIVRYLARKHNIIPQGMAPMVQGEEGEQPITSPLPPSPMEETPPPPPPAASADAVPLLRKLTLEDIPRSIIPPLERPLELPFRHGGGGRSRRGGRSMEKRKEKPSTTSLQEQIKKKEGTVFFPVQISVKEFAEKAGVQVPLVIQALMTRGVMATVNQTIDYETAAIVAADLGVTAEREQQVVRVEDLLSHNLGELLKDEPENLVPRPPVVVIMGHVDHGKTSLLDAIRTANVAGGESGGITQHIGAYQVGEGERVITFLDTPGHQAFTAMRARGAQVTDIVVLVVAADEGVMETTIEAIDHAKAAEVPILVAITKIDKPSANPEKVKGEIASHDLQPEEWGGRTPIVLCSAVTKEGIPALLDRILLLAESEKCTANPKRAAIATVIESHLDSALGPLGTVIVNTGTLCVGDCFACGRTFGKVRSMTGASGSRFTDVPPSGAVEVAGFQEVPTVGDILQVVPSERCARDLAEEVKRTMAARTHRGFADLVTRLTERKAVQLKIVLKADAQGSLEAITSSLEKHGTAEAVVKVIHGAVGAVSETDVSLAAASEGVVIAFRVPVSLGVQRTAEQFGIEIREYDVIYTLLEELEGLLQGLLIPEEEEKVLGHLEVKGVFFTKGSEQIIGGRVTDGLLKRVLFRVSRGGKVCGQGKITSLRKVDKDVKEVKEGAECGLKVETQIPIELGDTLEVFSKEFRKKV